MIYILETDSISNIVYMEKSFFYREQVEFFANYPV